MAQVLLELVTALVGGPLELHDDFVVVKVGQQIPTDLVKVNGDDFWQDT